ncbi:MAG TPA: MarR family winged helix-turn-helix transcriptional regulator [Chloroflexia bacterium]|nr:MarR family winged helix-turn-helix transcriptional regulator [Chloroflexia bacterium]
MTQADELKANKTKLPDWQRLGFNTPWPGNTDMPLLMRLSSTSKLVKQRFEEKSRINSSQVRVLLEAACPEGVSQAALHKNYKVDPASITRTVQVMERDGLVTRQVDPHDNRLMRVYLTEKGRNLLATLPEKVARFEQDLIKNLSESEVSQLHELLTRLVTGLQEEAPGEK